MKTHDLREATRRAGQLLLWVGFMTCPPLRAQLVPDVQWNQPGLNLAVSTDGNVVTTLGITVGGPERPLYGVAAVKYSVAGDQTWSRPLNGLTALGPGFGGVGVLPIGSIQAMAATQDGGTVFVGTEQVSGTQLLAKLSAAGAQVWTKQILRSDFLQTPNNTQVFFEDIVGTPDGGSLLLVTSAEPNAKTVVYVQKYDANGNVQWTQSVAYPTPNPATPDRSLTKGEAVINAPDAGYLLAGYYNTSGNLGSPEVGWVAKLDAQGNVAWQKLLNGLPLSSGPNGPVPLSITTMQLVTDVLVSADGAGYALVGTGILPNSVVVPPPALAILELNLDGSFRRARSLSMPPSEAFITRYKQYYAVGHTVTFNGPDPQILLVDPTVRPLTDIALLLPVTGRVFADPNYGPLLAIGTAGDGTIVFATTANDFIVKLKGEGLRLLQPTYDCQTGGITFNTTGGDGTPITYTAPGISRSSPTSNTGTVEPGLRADPKPIPIQATQSGVTATYVFNLATYCAGPPIGGPLVLLDPTYNCQTGAIAFNVSGGDGTTITYTAPGISRSSPTSNTGTVEPGLQVDPKPIPIQATQSGITTTYVFNLPGACGRSARRAAPVEGTDVLRVLTLGNPVDADLTVEVRGAGGQALRLDVVDGRGRLVGQRGVEQAGAMERHTFDLRQQPPGIFLLRAVTDRQSQTVKVLKQ